MGSVVTVAIQGQRGSYSELGALEYFGDAKTIKLETFSEAFAAVGKRANYAFVPVENSIEGIVTQVCDLLMGRNLHVVGESILRIEHCLIANKGVLIKDIKTVFSHPQALAQSRKCLESLGVEIVPFSDTAGSIKMIKEKGLTDCAGVASRYASQVYGMDILRTNLENHSHNYTRFLALSRKEQNSSGKESKTSIWFATKNASGALYKALGCFAKNKINLTYLQSRPVPGKPWEYRFYLECQGSIADTGLKAAVTELEDIADKAKVLGSYAPAQMPAGTR